MSNNPLHLGKQLDPDVGGRVAGVRLRALLLSLHSGRLYCGSVSTAAAGGADRASEHYCVYSVRGDAGGDFDNPCVRSASLDLAKQGRLFDLGVQVALRLIVFLN